MIAHTHRLMGDFLYHQLSTPLKAKLNYQRFVNGNIKPDVVKKYKQMSHYYQDNEDDVFGMFETLLHEPLSLTEFSDLAGVLLHFICDYACIYHANAYIRKDNTLAAHIQYETRLHYLALRKIKKIKEVPFIAFKSLEENRRYVRELVRRTNIPDYRPDIEHDFHEMVKLSLSTLFFLLSQRNV